jgi:hypothetical protein
LEPLVRLKTHRRWCISFDILLLAQSWVSRLAFAGLKHGAQKNRIKVGEEIEVRPIATNIDGTYAQGTCKFKIENPAVANITDPNGGGITKESIDASFQNELATAKVKGFSEGETDIIITN